MESGSGNADGDRGIGGSGIVNTGIGTPQPAAPSCLGMTETTPLATVSHLKPHLKKLPQDEQYLYRAKQGTPVPFVEIRVVNEKGEAPWDGKTLGELQIRGPWISGSYYNRPDTQDAFTNDGWLRTGDVATIDPEGYMKLPTAPKT